jgi:exopolysaccharide biosynthesis polyprenyl glycosylphosphotransferase
MTNDSEKEIWTSTFSFEQPQLPSLGDIKSFNEFIGEVKPEEILIAVKSPEHSFLLEIVANCANQNIHVKIVPDLYDFFTGQARTLPLYGIPLIEISTQLLKPWEEAFKRLIDILLSLVIILAGIPLWILIALIIKLESKGTVFFTQQRVGKKGKIFFIYKFRSMIQEADKGGPKWTTIGDTRVTKFGRIIRRSHLDEFPQFWNVLKGEMSLVGPRPEQPFFVQKYSSLVPYYIRRLVVRPGITGWWQIKYTSYEESVEEIESRLKDDFYYIENISLKLDLEIIIRTIFLVFRGHGQT